MHILINENLVFKHLELNVKSINMIKLLVWRYRVVVRLKISYVYISYCPLYVLDP